jgi:nicotinate-nucleotide pyrophosphorylase (carboxylating)
VTVRTALAVAVVPSAFPASAGASEPGACPVRAGRAARPEFADGKAEVDTYRAASCRIPAMSASMPDLKLVLPLVEAALAEDVGRGDATTEATVPETAQGVAAIRAKETGVVCGLAVARAVFERVDGRVIFEADAADGDRVEAGTVVARLRGPARALLTGERTALNFLQHLSGIATATRRTADLLQGTGVRILDTRKTVPAMRVLAKYAVRMGGGTNHRQGLFDMVLIKENHIAAAGGITAAITRARQAHPELALEVEVTDLAELAEALDSGPDRVLLDNFDPAGVRDAVAAIAEWTAESGGKRPEVELSGRITPETARDYAIEGVDFISSGALTHSVKALDLSMELSLAPRDTSVGGS